MRRKRGRERVERLQGKKSDGVVGRTKRLCLGKKITSLSRSTHFSLMLLKSNKRPSSDSRVDLARWRCFFFSPPPLLRLPPLPLRWPTPGVPQSGHCGEPDVRELLPLAGLLPRTAGAGAGGDFRGWLSLQFSLSAKKFLAVEKLDMAPKTTSCTVGRKQAFRAGNLLSCVLDGRSGFRKVRLR